jgi:hypothetical protein
MPLSEDEQRVLAALEAEFDTRRPVDDARQVPRLVGCMPLSGLPAMTVSFVLLLLDAAVLTVGVRLAVPALSVVAVVLFPIVLLPCVLTVRERSGRGPGSARGR